MQTATGAKHSAKPPGAQTNCGVATNATTQVKSPPTSSITCGFTVTRSRLHAHSAITQPHKFFISKHTCGPIQEKNLSVAQYATFLAPMLVL